MIRNFDENAFLKSSRIALLVDIILSVTAFDTILPKPLNLSFAMDKVLSWLCKSLEYVNSYDLYWVNLYMILHNQYHSAIVIFGLQILN